ncbi:trypsin-like peptidase domain-containing protein [Eubacteriales bacterium OttesenSCG-928-K08]|nr:trypsin-like peptidase domain-containing protein [Eubacteriales bacterium OttesenSCG-928-K08]
MDNEKNYIIVDPEETKGKKKSRARTTILAIIGVVAVLGVSVSLLFGLIQSAKAPVTDFFNNKPQQSNDSGLYNNPSPNSDVPSKSSPSPTPLATQRPMAKLDGVAPLVKDKSNPVPDIYDAVSESIVGIVVYKNNLSGDQRLEGMGSGFVVSSEGYVITNAHVVSGADSVFVSLSNGLEIETELIGADNESDVAVLKVQHDGLVPLKLGDSDDTRVGEYVVAIGNPLGRGFEGSVTKGIISARSRAVTIDGRVNLYIQTDAAINLGNSGGPLFNMKGEVIGVNTAKTINAGYDSQGSSISAEGMSFALPINKVVRIAEHLITKGYVEKAALGVRIKQLTRAELNDIGLSYGILIHSITQGGPADKAGLKENDIIISCDDVVFDSTTEMSDYITSQASGTPIRLEVWRDGKTFSVEVRLVNMAALNYDPQ